MLSNFPINFFPEFFYYRVLGGALKKYIFFNFFEGGEKNWNFPKTPLNEKKIG